MGKSAASLSTFEVVVGHQSKAFEVHEHKFVGTLCAGLLAKLGFGQDLTDWQLREASGKVVPFDCTERRAEFSARRHYYLVQVTDGECADEKRSKRKRARRHRRR